LGAFSIVPVKDSLDEGQFYLKGHLLQVFYSFIFPWCLSAFDDATTAMLLASSRLNQTKNTCLLGREY